MTTLTARTTRRNVRTMGQGFRPTASPARPFGDGILDDAGPIPTTQDMAEFNDLCDSLLADMDDEPEALPVNRLARFTPTASEESWWAGYTAALDGASGSGRVYTANPGAWQRGWFAGTSVVSLREVRESIERAVNERLAH